MYPYHNRNVQRIKRGELLAVRAPDPNAVAQKDEDEYAFVLVYKTPPYLRPIKRSAVYRYEKILSENNFSLPNDF